MNGLSATTRSDRMRLLVTGGAGYIGSICAARLVEAGHDVVVLDDLSTGHRDAVPAACRFIEGPVEDAGAVLAEGFDGVLHFAARSLVAESMALPQRYWLGNVVASLRLLEAMREHRTPRLVFSSTAATYGEPASVPITEEAAGQPTNPYGATKLAIDHAISSYASAHGIAAVSLRYFNVAGAYGRYGERHTVETHLIPLVLQVALGLRDKLMVFGQDWPDSGWHLHPRLHPRGGPRRCAPGGRSSTPSPASIGSTTWATAPDSRSSRSSTPAAQVTGHPIPVLSAPRRPGDPAVLIAASDRARCELGWKPQRDDLVVIVADAWEFARNGS